MKIILSYIVSLLILWIPILLIEETVLFEIISSEGAMLCSFLIAIIGLVIYIKIYKSIDKEKINCYLYNIINTILLSLTNIVLGYFFMHLIDINVFHQCMGEGWSCFLFGIEYLVIGIWYALFAIAVLIIWLFIRFIKYLKNKQKE